MRKLIQFLFLLCWLLAKPLSAQIDVTNDGLFFVKDSQLVHINGNFSNYSSEFKNRGDFGLTGSLVNEARVFNQGAGIFRFYGDQEQSLFLYQAFSTYDMELNNPEGLTMMGSSSLQLFNEINFFDGILRTKYSSLISFEPFAYHTNASDFSHINGPMRRLGSTDFIFPVGKGGLLRAPAVTDLAGLTRFQVEYFNVGHPISKTDNSLERVNDQEYWEIRQVEGFSTGRVTIPYDEATGFFPDLDQLEMAFWDTAQWTKIEFVSDGASPMMGLTSENLLNKFKYFTTAQNRILRDKITLSLEQNEECEISVNWVLPPEYIAEYYEVQRSFDGLSFMKIGEVPGDSVPSNDYTVHWLIDPILYKEETLYYRLKIYFADGSFIYSNVPSLENECIFEDCILFPNPVRSRENIKLRMESDSTRVMDFQIWSTIGRLLSEGDLEIKEGRNDYEIPTKELRLPFATYYLTVGRKKNLKFVVIDE